MSEKPTLIPRSHNLEERVRAQLPEGEVINARTAADIRFFERHPDLWVNIKANDDAQSCDDAAGKRGQLGSTGVPLHVELKTIASIYQKPNGQYQIVLAHCPADEEFDNAALKKAIGIQSKLWPFETEAIPFGTFSPFLFDQQFIDEELKSRPFKVKQKTRKEDTVKTVQKTEAEKVQEAEQAQALLDKAQTDITAAEKMLEAAKMPDDQRSAKKAKAQANKLEKQAEALLKQASEDTKTIKLQVDPETWYDIDLDKLDPDTPVLHVFHEDLANRPDVFNHTTTNFGHHNLGVQFRPHEVIPTMVSNAEAIVANITPNTVTKCFAYVTAREVEHTALFFTKQEVPVTRASEHTQHKIGIVSDSETNDGLSIMEQIEEAYIALFDGNFPGDLAMPGFNLQSVGALNPDHNTSEQAITFAARAMKLIEDGCTIITAETEVSSEIGDMLGMLCRQHGAYYIHANGVNRSIKQRSDAGDNTPQQFAKNIAEIAKNLPKIDPFANSFSPVFQRASLEAIFPPLFSSLSEVVREDPPQRVSDNISPNSQKIGIMTGNASSSGRLLLEKLKSYLSELTMKAGDNQIAMPDFVLRSQPKFGLSMEMNANAHDIANILREEAKKLIDDGCTVIALACNTMDVFDDMLQAMCQKAGVQFVPIHSLVKNQLNEMGVTDVSILGADPVASLGRWSTYSGLSDGYTVHDTPEIDEIGYAVKNRRGAAAQIDAVKKVFGRVTLGDLGEDKNPAVIAALTELSEILTRHPDVMPELGLPEDGVAIIDTMDLHAREIARVALAGLDEGAVEPDMIDELNAAIQFPRALRADGLKPLVV